MNQENYKYIRGAYYIGIFVLAIYALPAIPFVKDLVIPFLNFEIVPNLPLISVVAIATGIGAFLAYKYRRIG